MLGTILPAVGSDKRREWTIKTLLRRGVAYTQLASQPNSTTTGGGDLQSAMSCLDAAVSDYAQASALDPANEALKTDLNKLKTHRESRRTTLAAQ